MKVLIAERISDEAIQYLEDKGLTADLKLDLQPEELEGIIGDYEGLIVRSVTKVNASLLAKATKLKIVGRGGVGTDNIDIPCCTEKGILVANTPEANTMAAAELAVALALSIFRNLPEVQIKIRQGDFRRADMIGHEVEGKTAAVIGFGHIGSTVARKLKGVGMHVVCYDPVVTKEQVIEAGFEYENNFEELIKRADLITVHTPKIPQTVNMINKDNIKLCKQGVYIVNASRGGLINEEALYDALKSGLVRGAAIDVFDVEPSYDKDPKDQTYTHPLLTLDNCLVTPHLGASTEEANFKVGEDVSKIVADALTGKDINAINKKALAEK